MNVLVLGNMRPFHASQIQDLSDRLVANLLQRKIAAERFFIPFPTHSKERLIDDMAICRQLRINNVDRVIALEFPVYHIPHPTKVLWLSRPPNIFDSTLTTGTSTHSPRGHEIERMLIGADRASFAASRRLFSSSPWTAEEIFKRTGLESEVLLPPLDDFHAVEPAEYGEYIFASTSGANCNKLRLLIDAMRHLPPSARLIIAGTPATDDDAESLRQAARLNANVTLKLEDLAPLDLASLIGNARAVAHFPENAWPLQRIPMAAFESGKAVITTDDAGALSHFIVSGETGVVTEPTLESLASALAEVTTNVHEAKRMGLQARDHWRAMRSDWTRTIERLLS